MLSEKLKSTSNREDRNHHPKAFVIILNWNQWSKTIRCLESVLKSSFRDIELLVIDNGSTDNSYDRIKEWIFNYSATATSPNMPKMEVISTRENLGYSGGNNYGIRIGMKKQNIEFIILLNNDTMMSPDAIEILVNHAVSEPKFAFLGPKILYLDRADIIQSKGFMISKDFLEGKSIDYGLKDFQDERDIIESDAIYGACLVSRVEYLNKIGLLDDVFFMYGEDLDWCIRAKRKGFKIGCVPSAKIWHEDQVSSKEMGDQKWFHIGRGQTILIRRYSSSMNFVRFLISGWPRRMATIVSSNGRILPGIWYAFGIMDVTLAGIKINNRNIERL